MISGSADRPRYKSWIFTWCLLRVILYILLYYKLFTEPCPWIRGGLKGNARGPKGTGSNLPHSSNHWLGFYFSPSAFLSQVWGLPKSTSWLPVNVVFLIMIGQISSRELEGKASASQRRSWSLTHSPGILLAPCSSSQGGADGWALGVLGHDIFKGFASSCCRLLDLPLR